MLAKFEEGETGIITMNAHNPEQALEQLKLVAEQEMLARTLPVMLYEQKGYIEALLEITASELRPIFGIRDDNLRIIGLRPFFLDRINFGIDS